MLIKTLAGITLFAALGAAIGYSEILCAGGECAITGTPYGGAFFGGMLGFAVMSSLNPGAGAVQSTDDNSQSPASTDGDPTESAEQDTDPR